MADRVPAGRPPASFAEALRRARSAAHLTQEELADRAGVSVRTISDLERGVHETARRATLERISAALGLGPAEAEAWRAFGRRGALRPPSRPFVGRDETWRRYARTWDRVQTGRAAALHFGGEAGIGKSRLLAELASDAAGRGATVLTGRCDGAVHAPYQPLLDAVRPHLASASVCDAIAALGPAAGVLGLVDPALARLVPAPAEDLDVDAGRVALLGALTAVLDAVAGPSPLVVTVDDVHGVDPSTLLVLEHLVRRRDRPLLVVLAGRDAESAESGPLTGFLDGLEEAGLLERSVLQGLPGDAVAVLVEHLTGSAPAPDVVAALLRRTGGNPFFVEELLAEASEGSVDLPTAVASVPSGARAVVAGRLRRLTDPARQAVRTAAVVGSAFDPLLVELVAAPEVADGLDEAVRAGFLDVAGDRMAFRHDIVREVVLDGTGRREAAEVHWRVGEGLLRIHAADLGAHLEEIASHLLRGVGAGDAAVVGEVLERLGSQQFRALALDEAVDTLTSALAVTPPGAEGDARRLRMLELLAETHFWRDDPDAMRAAAHGAADLARRVGTPEDLARTAIVAARWNRAGDLDTGILELLDEAVARLGPGDSGALSQLVAMRAYVLQGAARGFDTRSLAREAVAMARRCGDDEALAMALTASTYTEAGAATLDRTRAIVAELESTAPRVPRRDHRQQYAVFGLRGRALVQLSSGDLAGFAATRAELEAVTLHMRSRFVPGQLRYWDAALAAAAGRFDDAERLSAEALAVWDARPDAMRAHQVQLAAVRLERGGAELVLPALEHLVSGDRTSVGYAVRAVVAAGLAAAGRHDEARARLDDLARDGFAGLADDHHRPRALRWLGELVAVLRAEDEAAELLPLAEPHGGQLLLGSAISTVEAAADRVVGQLHGVLGDGAAAEARYQAALELEGRLGFAALEARTRRWWAQGVLRTDRDAGRDEARAAADAATRLGMAQLAREATGLATFAGRRRQPHVG